MINRLNAAIEALEKAKAIVAEAIRKIESENEGGPDAGPTPE